jgi:hypothetical protein
MQPLSLRLWRVPASARVVTVRRTGALRLGVVVRRGAAERGLASGGALRLAGGQGSLLLLVIGGAGGTQDVRLTLSA